VSSGSHAVPDDSPTWKIENRFEIVVSGSRVSPTPDPVLPVLFAKLTHIVGL
jgi:hypothetical protein